MAVLKRALSGSEPARGPKLARTFTANSAAAVGAAFPLLSPADWARTRHLLQLAHGRDDGGRGGGDTALASEWHAGLLPDVRAGNVAAVAREVRRRSTAQAWEAGLWADAAAETSTYTVVSADPVPLRSAPPDASPGGGNAVALKFPLCAMVKLWR